MSPQRTSVRSRRSPRRVVVVGAAGAAGGAVATALTAAGHAVTGVDERRGSAPVAIWRVGDVTGPDGAELVAGAHDVVHVAAADDLEDALARPPAARRARAVAAARAVGQGASAAGARRVVVVTSAMVHGAAPENRLPLPDDAPVRVTGDDGLAADLVEVEATHAALAVAGATALTFVRPAALVGPGVDSLVTRHFEAPRLLHVRGSRTAWQFCHVDDLGAAVVAVLGPGPGGGAVAGTLDGPVGVGCDGWLDDAATQRLTGRRPVDLPPALAFGTAERLHRVGVLPMPAADLAYVVHPWAVSSARLRAAGWAPSRTNEDCLTEMLALVAGNRAVAGRRVDGREAATGAAGAAVALLGAAALVRRARARGRGGRRPTL